MMRSIDGMLVLLVFTSVLGVMAFIPLVLICLGKAQKRNDVVAAAVVFVGVLYPSIAAATFLVHPTFDSVTLAGRAVVVDLIASVMVGVLLYVATSSGSVVRACGGAFVVSAFAVLPIGLFGGMPDEFAMAMLLIAFNIWYAFVFTSLIRWTMRRAAALGYSCPRCLYDLRELSADVCPECGAAIAVRGNGRD